MKIISKLRFALISAIYAVAFTSCEDSSETLFSISDSEMTQLKNPEVKIFTRSSYIQVEVTFSYPIEDSIWFNLYYLTNGSNKTTAKCVSYSDTEFVYELPNLVEGKEYFLYFSDAVYLLKNNIRLRIDSSPWSITLRREIIYSSPIALKDRLDAGWTQIDLSGNNIAWESVTISGNQAYGDVGFAAFFTGGNTWLISPRMYLEEGRKYELQFYGHSAYNQNGHLDVYINESNNPEDIRLTNPNRKTVLYSDSYKSNNITFIPESSGYYYCAFYPTDSSEIYLTGFKVTTIMKY